jgi:hypothetical protein
VSVTQGTIHTAYIAGLARRVYKGTAPSVLQSEFSEKPPDLRPLTIACDPQMFPTFTPGEWYLTVTCSACKTRLALRRDFSEGQSKIVGGYRFLCPHCDDDGDYTPDQVEHYQHPA